MTDQTPTGGSDIAPANDAPLTIREAAEALAARREAELSPQPEAPEPDPVEPAEPQNSSQEDTGAAEIDQPPADDTDQGQDDPAPEEPSIEPPRSWTKEEKEAFKLLPPEHQQRIAERERTREADIRRGQDEVAKERKALEAKLSEADKVRQQYEAALPQLVQQLNAQQNAEFSDIRSHADVVKMAEEDPFRFSKWQALQMQKQAAVQQHQQAQQRQQHEAVERFTSWAQEQDQRAKERIPELSDPEKGRKAQLEAVNYLKEVVGWDEGTIANRWNGQESFSVRDADFQVILRDAARWQAAQKAAQKAAAKPVPPVQRPGTAANKADAQATEIQALTRKLERASSTQEQIRLAAQLRALKTRR